MSDLVDVFAVNMTTHKMELLSKSVTQKNGDAVINMAVARRGCDDYFYASFPPGKYHEGDEWDPDDDDFE